MISTGGCTKRHVIALFALCLLAEPATANPVKSACVSSERARGQQDLCSCIQRVADQTLTERDQKLVARFFKDPERAQAIRQSNSRVHEDFWERYERFGRSAEALCRR